MLPVKYRVPHHDLKTVLLCLPKFRIQYYMTFCFGVIKAGRNPRSEKGVSKLDYRNCFAVYE